MSVAVLVPGQVLHRDNSTGGVGIVSDPCGSVDAGLDSLVEESSFVAR